jgi:hypothetical protein
MRTTPKSSVFMVIGLGASAEDPPTDCVNTNGDPYDNQACSSTTTPYCGGLCNDLFKDTFMQRLAGQSEKTTNPYPSIQSAADINKENKGNVYHATNQDELVSDFMQAATVLKKLRIVR